MGSPGVALTEFLVSGKLQASGCRIMTSTKSMRV